MRRNAGFIAVALAAVAGFVDAVGFITLHGLFIAHMSGNSVKFGVRVGQGDFSAAAPVGIAVALFVGGVAIGTVAAELAARTRARSVAAVVLGLQTTLIVAFMLYGSSARGFYVLSALGILSMGMQTAALRQLAGQVISTTYVTGVITSLTQEAANYVFWLHDGRERDERHSFLSGTLGLGTRAESRARIALLGGIWVAYAGGGIAGSASDGWLALWSLVAPIVVLAAIVAHDLWHPTIP